MTAEERRTLNLKITKRYKKFIVFMVVILLSWTALLLYHNRENIIDNIANLQNQYQNTAETSFTEFPISISSYQIKKLSDSTAIFSNGHFYSYDEKGKNILSRQLTYESPVLKTYENRALVYESGGNRLSVFSKSKLMYSETTDDIITYACIGKSGMTAVLTESTNKMLKITVFDAQGNDIYIIESRPKTWSMAISPNGKGLITVETGTENGSFYSKANYYDLTSEKSSPVYSTDSIEGLCLEVYGTDEGGVFMVCDREASFFDKKGKMLKNIKYTSQPKSFTYEKGKAVFLIYNDSTHQAQLAIINGYDNNPIYIEANNDMNYLASGVAHFSVLTNDSVMVYNYSGKVKDTVKLKKIYTKVIPSGNAFYLAGEDIIERKEYRDLNID
ncbi:MAG: DUF5711 family protein [Ruminococcus sp.]|jgi:hypothetical protein|nr:DUF5711 family protein [Ruminococcus sp.]